MCIIHKYNNDASHDMGTWLEVGWWMDAGHRDVKIYAKLQNSAGLKKLTHNNDASSFPLKVSDCYIDASALSWGNVSVSGAARAAIGWVTSTVQTRASSADWALARVGNQLSPLQQSVDLSAWCYHWLPSRQAQLKKGNKNLNPTQKRTFW